MVVALSFSAVPESRDPHATRGLDYVGAALAVVTLGAATWALTEAGPRGWSDPAVLVGAIVAAAGRVVRLPHAPRSCSPGAAGAVPQPHVHRDQSGHRPLVRRARSVLLPGRVPAAGRGRVVARFRPAPRSSPRPSSCCCCRPGPGRSPSASDRACSSRPVRSSRPPGSSCSPASVPTPRGEPTSCPARSCSASGS